MEKIENITIFSNPECVPYLSALEVCSLQGAIQIHVYLTFTFILYLTYVSDPTLSTVAHKHVSRHE